MTHAVVIENFNKSAEPILAMNLPQNLFQN